jgi:N-methylhydantoinase A
VAIIRIANAHMALALRAVSVQRGQDPRDFALVAFGGAGPLHACELARELKIPVVIIPRLPGQFSAWGMLTCDLRHDYVQTLMRDFDSVDPQEIVSAMTTLVDYGLSTLRNAERKDGSAAEIDCGLDLRYRGQEYTVTVPLPGASFTAVDRTAAATRFHELHRLLYGHSAPEQPLELVAVRVTVLRAVEKNGPLKAPTLSGQPLQARPYIKRRVYMGEDHGFMETAVYRRDELAPGARLAGPTIIEEAASTTVVLPHDRVKVASTGELVIEIAEEKD